MVPSDGAGPLMENLLSLLLGRILTDEGTVLMYSILILFRV